MKRALALGIALSLAGCEEAPSDSNSFVLPANIREVSGLAVASENSVFAHDDEHAIIHEIELENGKVIRSFALGDPTIEGDFEGIATAEKSVFLVTSDGLIYAFPEGENRTRVAYRPHDSGIGPRCEIEGLARAPSRDHLLLLCKRLRSGDDVQRLEVYRWKIGTEHAESEPWLAIPLDQILNENQRAEFMPSGLEWDEARQRLLIVSGRNRLLVELDREGGMIAARSLDPSRHKRTEGITILPGCRLALADEGTDTAKARLAVYPCPGDEPGA